MAPPLLTLKDIRLTWGGEPLFSGVDLAIGRGERICLVGRNGSGKSTLMGIMAGRIEADAGEIFVQPGCRVVYLPQDPDMRGYAHVLDYVAAGLADADEDALHRAEAMLQPLGLEPMRAVEGLSGGERRRAAIARALAGRPDVLLLDEPTNHLDLPAIRWLEDELKTFRGAVVVISHDRSFLRSLTRATLWLDRGRIMRLEKGFEAFEEWSEEILTREAVEAAKLDKLIAEETRWSHEGISARRKRNQGRMRRLAQLRKERAANVKPTGRVKLEAESGSLSGHLVVEAEAVSKSYGERTIIRDFSTRIMRGDRVGIIGPNGAGKTTLLKLLTGELSPDSGSVRLGTNLTMVHVDQSRSLLDTDRSVWDTLCDCGGDQIMVRGRPRHVVSYLKDFLFDPRHARGPVGALSGGERNRLLLAKTLARPSNFLVLDEPTNDLDMDTLDLLQEMLADYDGTVLLVSHDRDFLDRVVTSTIVIEGDGRAVEYAGGWSDVISQKKPEETSPSSETETPRKSDRGERASAPTKLSYKHQRRLEELPTLMAKAETEIARLEETLADAGLYTRDADAFHNATINLDKARDHLAGLEEEWLEIEMMKEEIQQSTTR